MATAQRPHKYLDVVLPRALSTEQGSLATDLHSIHALQVDVCSSWRDKIVGSNAMATETLPMSVEEVATQTGSSAKAGTQTDEVAASKTAPSKAQSAGIAEFVKR